MNKVEFGIWIRSKREDKGWSQADLARESGLYRSIINNIENGVSNSSPATLNALAKALGQPPEMLFEMLNLLPAKNNLSEIKRRLIHVAESEELLDSDIELVITLLEQRIDLYKKHPKAKPAQ